MYIIVIIKIGVMSYNSIYMLRKTVWVFLCVQAATQHMCSLVGEPLASQLLALWQVYTFYHADEEMQA